MHDLRRDDPAKEEMLIHLRHMSCITEGLHAAEAPPVVREEAARVSKLLQK